MDKPSYVPLLNTIAVNEKKGELFLSAWANATPDADLAEVLRFVAIREGEHAWAFTKRLCELGYGVSEADAYDVFGNFEELLTCVSSKASDLEKIEVVTGGADGEGRDPFGRLFEDVTIDPATGALLGRYIAEERDSGRRLDAAYSAVRARAEDGGSAAELTELKATIKALKKEVKALKRLQ